jgi:cell division protein FtsX
MQSIKKLKDNKIFKISLFITVISLILFVLSFGLIINIGAFINKFYPCQEDLTQMNSLPCFAKYGIRVALAFFMC